MQRSILVEERDEKTITALSKGNGTIPLKKGTSKPHCQPSVTVSNNIQEQRFINNLRMGCTNDDPRPDTCSYENKNVKAN
jgi:hypothetical protein